MTDEEFINSGRKLPPFPLDTLTLEILEKSLDVTIDNRPDGEFTLSQFLEFMSGFEHKQARDTGETIDGIPVYLHPDQRYTESDVIRALVGQILKLRNQTEDRSGR